MLLLKLLLTEKMLYQAQCGADHQVEEESSSEVEESTCGNEEYITNKKSRSVES